MRKELLLLCVILLSTASTGAAANVKPYVSLSAGAFMPTDITVHNGNVSSRATMDAGYVVSGAFGIAFGKGVRLEAEISHRATDLGRAESLVVSTNTMDQIGIVNSELPDRIVATSGMINVFYDQKTGTPITPYIGGGFGVSHVDIEKKTAAAFGGAASGNDTVFAYQAGAGLGLDLTQHLTLDLGYRFFGMETFSFGGSRTRLDSHNATVGVRYLF